MSVPMEASNLERFRAAIVRRLGLHFDENRHDALRELLRRRSSATGRSCDAYLRELDTLANDEEWRVLVPELTVAETYFFRNVEQFRALAEIAVPERVRRRAACRQLRVLSAGCASGEEAFSLAACVRDAVADPSWEITVLAIDVNPRVLEKAARGRFSDWALRETPGEFKERWFRAEAGEFALSESVRRSVRFECRNLVHDDATFWQPESFDVVFCRNVLMYFAAEPLRAIVGRITSALAPGGYLFLGHAETLRGLSDDFHLRHTHSTFYYQRKERREAGTERAPRSFVPRLSARATLAARNAVSGATADWASTIRRSSERIESLAQDLAVPGVATAFGVGLRADVIDPPRAILDEPMDLLRRERFADALARVEALPAAAKASAEILLLEAVLLTHRGELARAQAACSRLLVLDELDAGAHYVLALCREGANDEDGASEHSRTAVHLDPSFAMPRLHLGLLTRRRGQVLAARGHLESAVALLRRETAERMALFGGGFGREAWMTLCRAELAACGGRG